jgi:hypothetical protein
VEKQVDGKLLLPKNIRQMGNFGDTYKIYIEDFVYTYVHQLLHQKKREESACAAVLLGETFREEGWEYVFISGALGVDVSVFEETPDASNVVGHEQNLKGGDVAGKTGVSGKGTTFEEERSLKFDDEDFGQEASFGRISGTKETENSAKSASVGDEVGCEQDLWTSIFQGIKEYFCECEILGWYINLDGSNLQIHPNIQQFFETTYSKGSRFLYYEDSVEKQDAFFVQEQHILQRINGYAVYYAKNPQMQEYMIAEKERMMPNRRQSVVNFEKQETDVAQNYRAIMNKLNEKPTQKRVQPMVYVAGVAVLAIVAATGVTQIGNYQNLRSLQSAIASMSGAVSSTKGEETSSVEESNSTEEQASSLSELPSTDAVSASKSQNTDAVSASESQNTDAVSVSEPQSTDATSSPESQSTNVTSASESQSTNVTSSDVQQAGNTASSADQKNAAMASAGEQQATDTASTQEQQNTNAAGADYYVVQRGDSLVSISKAMYQSTDMIEEICSLNQIEDMDVIYEGQKLLLP